MRPLPDSLLAGPFTRAEARRLGVSDRMLQGARFVRVLPGVWAHRDLDLTWDQRLAAARLALPGGARVTGITRLQLLGLDLGERDPLHFVIEGDLHLHLPGVFLHRTVRLAPADAAAIGPAGAFLAYCATARLVDAVKVGDWLLSRGHLTRSDLVALALAAPCGAHEAIWVADHLDARSRSLPESELRVLLTFAGLPRPEPNAALELDGVWVVGDLVYREHRVLLEYQGAHHQTEREVYVADLDRLELIRSHGWTVVEVTKERMRHARTLVGRVHRALVARGYDGPPPQVDARWTRLFDGLSRQVGPRHQRA